MAYCTYTDVRLIMDTSLTDAQITSLIALADQEIVDRELTGRGSVKLISMYLTAGIIASKEPATASIGGATYTAPLTAQQWRDQAEMLISRTGDLPIIVMNDPLPNE